MIKSTSMTGHAVLTITYRGSTEIFVATMVMTIVAQILYLADFSIAVSFVCHQLWGGRNGNMASMHPLGFLIQKLKK